MICPHCSTGVNLNWDQTMALEYAYEKNKVTIQRTKSHKRKSGSFPANKQPKA